MIDITQKRKIARAGLIAFLERASGDQGAHFDNLVFVNNRETHVVIDQLQHAGNGRQLSVCESACNFAPLEGVIGVQF